MIAAVLTFPFILSALWAVSSLSSSSRNDLFTVLGVRRAWPHGAGCSSCRCGAEAVPVIGAFAEMSSDVVALVDVTASVLSADHIQFFSTSAVEAKGIYKQRVRTPSS